MPDFDTPEPITATLHVGAGSLRVAAADRADTHVEVRPRDPKRNRDVRAAEQTEVGYANGVLTVRTKERRMVGPSGAVDVAVELPAGSRVDVTGSWTQVFGEGRLGEVHVKISSGDTRLGTTGPLRLVTSHGSVHVDRVEGSADIATSFGGVRVGTVDGPAVLKNSHGATSVGAALGDLRVRGAHGNVDVARAEGSVAATVAHGTLRVAEVARGTVSMENSYGAIEVGVRAGTAAWLDVSSERGQVRNALADSGPPEEVEDTVKILARTRWGTIDVRRAGA
ncbi:DUF4097 family beta strand repeat-containing protein [Streptomyces sp. DSM 42041]|uniref:DUF4097 family beta strand repeat-containing protein n=1 Tax=Streptomyces hazeniae TaxID=3075538 RepID=A0ABU2NMU5_9ACTN|nr:DUF4097 family beta strand repeat-containing protein [Streptomyces sp. DSM 42041]MDT0378268.1 DUF4097 family beta strand repeat-containing protein [Streptomyces sp. DSM 42041]